MDLEVHHSMQRVHCGLLQLDSYWHHQVQSTEAQEGSLWLES